MPQRYEHYIDREGRLIQIEYVIEAERNYLVYRKAVGRKILADKPSEEMLRLYKPVIDLRNDYEKRN